MIEIKELSRSFGRIKAVDRVSFAVESGEIVGFLGPNGAGKTTTMRMMVGYLQPQSGKIELDGRSVFDDPLAASARIGYLPEHNPLYPEMAVGEFLRYLGDLRRMKEPVLSQRLEFVREACALDEVWTQRIATLSKGYRQRTGLAGAILHDPEVLILDEPTGGLDPNQIMEIRELIRDLGQAKTVLLSSHIMQEVQALCSRVIIINKGRVIVDDRMENLGAHISGFQRVILELEAVEPDFTPWLEQNPEVKLDSQTQNGPICLLHFLAPAETDIRRELSAHVTARGWQLLSIYQEQQSLEKIFHELTSQEESPTAAEPQLPPEEMGRLVAKLDPIDSDLICPEQDLTENGNDKEQP
ncbi:MAG: ATP-binding cassette domain-containing protein [Candidatus Cloacimonetes bacterium]|nr:ATP-binding cassette domain-containing protein [Candidatus Cloacimonadota bacterium]MDY0367455.1 ATP-binding cassette domain-containing protein [Candidatus Syntrophosphaera sp.]